MLKLVKILKSFEIKDKFLEVVINNTSNNNIFKNKFDKILNRQEFQQNKQQNSVFCLTYIINLVTQDFISTIELETTNNNIVVQLKNKQLQNIAKSIDLSSVVKKIFKFVIIQKNNIYAKFIRFALLQLLLIVQFNVCFDLESFKRKSIKNYKN